MTTPQKVEFTRPGAHSAKNARQVGAPNTQQSGEDPMVGTKVSLSTNSIIVLGTAAYNNGRATLVGGLPRQGKTAAWRTVLLTDDELADVMATLPVVGGRDA